MCAKNYQIWLRRFKDKSKNVHLSHNCLDHAVGLHGSDFLSKLHSTLRAETFEFCRAEPW